MAARRAARADRSRRLDRHIVNRDIPEGLDKACDLAFYLAHPRHRRHRRADQDVETSFYGELEPYAKWLLISCCRPKGFDRLNDYNRP